MLVQGSSGVSVFALQFAKLAGARVIATSSSDEKLERLRALGADALINYRSELDTLAQSMLVTRVGGHIALIGVLSSVDSRLPLGLALGRQLRLQALIVGSRRQQQDMIRALEASNLRPMIDRHFPLEELVAAFQYQASGAHTSGRSSSFFECAGMTKGSQPRGFVMAPGTGLFGRSAGLFRRTASEFGRSAGLFGRSASKFGWSAALFGRSTSRFGRRTGRFGWSAGLFRRSTS